MSEFHLHVDNTEFMAALATLQRQMESAVGQERDRLIAGCIAIVPGSPEWVTSWLDVENCTAHFVPGPKLVDLLMPLDRLDLPRAARVPRWRRVVRHLKAAVVEAMRRAR